MELRQAIKERRSIRRYRPEPLPLVLVRELLEQAVWAPSNKNLQPWRLVAVTGEVKNRVIAAIADGLAREQIGLDRALEETFKDRPDIIQATRHFVRTYGNAPVLVMVYLDTDQRGWEWETPEGKLADFDRLATIESAAAVAQNLCLLAWEAGLGSCWTTAPTAVQAEVINAVLNVYAQELVAVVSLGYADQSPKAPRRKEGRIRYLGWEEE